MSRFYDIEPTALNFWRSIVLFGKNSASYKFSLAKSLIDLYLNGKSIITLEDLAIPYSKYICEHLEKHPKQCTSSRNSFLETLQDYIKLETSEDVMIEKTVKNGFTYVLDAFHNVHGVETDIKFFIDERKSNNGLRLSDDFLKLAEQIDFLELESEVEARWQLVESAWENNVSRNLMLVEYQEKGQLLVGNTSLRRVSVTSAKPALNGYQKGKCFYCYKDITIIQGNENSADVDHFFPHILRQCDNQKPINGVSNLVLSCIECNRGSNGKFDRIPSTKLLERLFNRNEYLITSHHPLRETLISQIGHTSAKRHNFLQEAFNCAALYVGAGKVKWEPSANGDAVF